MALQRNSVGFDDMDKASDSTCRLVLYGLCRNDRIQRKALQILTEIQPTVKEVVPEKPQDGAERGVKRKAEGQLLMCYQCEGPFSEEFRELKECQYHPGELEVDDDSDFWADHDENRHGTIDTDEMREEFPEGFTWTCCDEPGDKPGCKWSRHRCLADLSNNDELVFDSLSSDEDDDEDA